jgi:ribosome modulation factor
MNNHLLPALSLVIASAALWQAVKPPDVIEAPILEAGLRKLLDEKESESSDLLSSEHERITERLAAEAERMEAEGYEAGLAGKYRVVPRQCSCAGEEAWKAGWRRGRIDGGHHVP